MIDLQSFHSETILGIWGILLPFLHCIQFRSFIKEVEAILIGVSFVLKFRRLASMPRWPCLLEVPRTRIGNSQGAE
jgi:hypothetical protein